MIATVKGADCPDGARFIPKAAGSVWENQIAPDGGLQKRLVLCPAGYLLWREESNADLDECRRCELSTYLLNPVSWTGSNITQTSACNECEEGSVCGGGNSVVAKSGYWRMILHVVDEFEYLPEALCTEVGAVCLFPEGKMRRCIFTVEGLDF